MIRDGFVFEPPKELRPDYKLSPFFTTHLATNRSFPESDKIEKYFDQRFGTGKWAITSSGRAAISEALINYNLKRDDFITIFTTSGNRYISRCVTDEIEKFCKWSHRIENETRVILVNHEFGFPHENIEKIAGMGFPVIEDCAYSFLSTDRNNSTGTVGDFTIYSFPKFFPVQTGGLIVSNNDMPNVENIQNDPALVKYLKRALSGNLDLIPSIIEKRRSNYNLLKGYFERIGMRGRFDMYENVVPGVFMFRTASGYDLQALKVFMYGQGIECSVFYGEESFYIPVHQNLTDDDLLYFYESVKFFVKINR